MGNTRNLGDLGRDTNLTEFGEAFTLPTSDGTTGQVLQTNGSGTLTFADAGGGSLELLAVETVTTSVSAVDIDLPAEYSRFFIAFNNIILSSSGVDFVYKVSTDGGSTLKNPGNSRIFVTDGTSSAAQVGNYRGGNPAQLISTLAYGYSNANAFFGTLNLTNSSSWSWGNWDVQYQGTSSSTVRTEGFIREVFTDINLIRFYADSVGVTITSGDFYLYGYKETL